jgi:hypothetical protein
MIIANKNRYLHKFIAYALVILCLLLLSCDNIFFPNTGTPLPGGTLRSTPQGVVQQLILAYTNQRIDLYSDLFSPAKDFRFYVSQSFASEYNNGKPDSKPLENIDTMYQYIVQQGLSSCNYWTYSDEIQIHTKLFSQMSQITFTSQPNIYQIRYMRNSSGDTTNIEVVMTDGVIDMYSLVYYEGSDRFSDHYTINIEKQVFYLERDPADNRLWVIQKWFDLSTNS